MFTIVEKRRLNDSMTLMVVEAPFIAKKAKAGQFIILRVNEFGERIPLTVADYDREKGTITIIYQKVGKTTLLLDQLNVGDAILDFIGPLGQATELDNYKKVAVIGGGAGCAIAYPQAKALHNMGAKVDMIAGFRNKDIIILEDEMKAVSDHLIENGAGYDLVIAIGPLVMMRAVCNLTKEYNIKTLISMNPIMIDGTGMCGGCRLTVGGKTKFACVDGPDFDGHEVDFDEAIQRSRTYSDMEKEATREYNCHLMEGTKNA